MTCCNKANLLAFIHRLSHMFHLPIWKFQTSPPYSMAQPDVAHHISTHHFHPRDLKRGLSKEQKDGLNSRCLLKNCLVNLPFARLNPAKGAPNGVSKNPRFGKSSQDGFIRIENAGAYQCYPMVNRGLAHFLSEAPADQKFNHSRSNVVKISKIFLNMFK